MKQYLELVHEVIDYGNDRLTRGGEARSRFVRQMRFMMRDGFTIITTRKINFANVVAELLWFLSGSQNVHDLQAMGCHIWDANANSGWWLKKAQFDGDVGRIYGVQLRHWRTYGGMEIDQLTRVIESIKKNPYSRRHIITAWNPGELDQMCLPPCHMNHVQFYVANGKLSVHMVQRSADVMIGIPFNISSYALLLHLVAHVTGLQPHELIITTNDTHIYKKHFEKAFIQLERKTNPLPELRLNKSIDEIDLFTQKDIELVGYNPHGEIKYQMMVGEEG